MVDKSTRTRMKDYQNIGTGDNNILYFMDAIYVYTKTVVPNVMMSFIDIDECDYTGLLL